MSAGVAAQRRGDRILAREADEALVVAQRRADRQAAADEAAALRQEVERLRRELQRARRALAAERLARAARVEEGRAAARQADYAIGLLTRIAFPGDGR